MLATAAIGLAHAASPTTGVARPAPATPGVAGPAPAASAVSAAARPAPAGLRMIAGTPGEVRFEVEVPEPRLRPLPADPSSTDLGIDGYATTGMPGSPALPARIVLVAVPPTGEVAVQSTAAEVTAHEGVLLAPQPDLSRDPNGVSSPVYARSAGAYAARGSLAPRRATLVSVGWLRNQRVARVQVLPADYDPAARRLVVARRVEVVVSVTPSAPVTNPAETIDPFERVYASTVVNYEQGKQWRRPPARRPARGAPGAALAPGGGPANPFSIAVGDTIYAGRQWIKLAVTQPGLYRVDYGALRNLRPFAGGVTVDTSRIRLFSWRSPLPILPEQDYCDTCAYHEVPIGFVSDSVFTKDNNNYFYFYGTGPSDWANLYQPTKPDTVFFNHPYETTNYYYLTISTPGRPIALPTRRIPLVTADVDTIADSPPTFSSFPERIHYELNRDYFPDSPPAPDSTTFRTANGTLDTLSWQKWFWTTLSQGQATQVQFDLPGADLTQPVHMRMRVWGLVAQQDQCGYVFNLLDAAINGVAQPEVTWKVKGSHTYDLRLPNPATTGNTVTLAVPKVALNDCSTVGLAWIDAFYQRRLAPTDDSLTFSSPIVPSVSSRSAWATGGRITDVPPPTSGMTSRVVYRIGPFSSSTQPRLFDITDINSPAEIQGFTYQALDASRYQLAFAADISMRHRYTVVPDSKVGHLFGPTVFEAPQTSLFDLRRRKADYLVVYYDALGAAAESLAAWRHSHLPLPGIPAPYDTSTVPISALYDQFSGGRADPLAIRNFLRAVFLEQSAGGGARAPSFVTLLGDASYDYKKLLPNAPPPGQPGCPLPTFENGYDQIVLGGHQFTTDDWLLNVDDPNTILPDFFGGRIPVSDPQVAMDVVRNKVLFYERSTPFGEYRNRVMLIADDNFQCPGNEDPLHWSHLLQTADLDANYTPAEIDRRYVYLHTYPYGAAACSKPGARADIRTNLEDGVAMFNYIGHGSPFQIADEAVLIETDVGTLTNGPRYPLFVAASCDVGLFDDPNNQGLGERLLTQPGGGAVAVVSSTQLAFSGDNALLNGQLYDQLFDRSGGGQYHTSIAEALLVAKEATSPFGSLKNNMKYQLMGDAGTRLNLPRLWVDLAFQDTTGAPVTKIARGQTVQFAGRVLDAPGGSPVVINGTAALLIEDSVPVVSTPDGLAEFPYRAGPVYRADVAITGGRLGGRFVMPLEAREGTKGRVRAYATGRGAGQLVDSDAAGSKFTEIVCDTCLGHFASTDQQGPRIALSFPGGSTEVRPDATLNVDLFDPSGILITDHSPQNGIIVTLDGNSTTRADVTSTFRYAANSYQGGRATFTLPNLSLGTHRVQVSAADNLAAGFNAIAHRSSATLDFRVIPTTQLSIAQVYLFPDPTHSTGAYPGGQFVVDVPGNSIDVLLRIYTVNGRLIRTLKSLGGMNQVQLPWDGLDNEQAPLANGVYLFKVNVNGLDSSGAISGQQASAEGRFVVLNR